MSEAVDKAQSKDGANGTSQNGNNVTKLQMNTLLLSEAALDTPSFRATVNFFDGRVKYLSDWSSETALTLQNKYRPALSEFMKVQNGLLHQLLPDPNMVANGMLINQAFTPTLIDSFNKDFNKLAVGLLSIILGNDTSCSKVLNLLNGLKKKAIAPYVDKKNTFDYFQQKYDSAHARYSAIEPTKVVANSTNIDATSVNSSPIPNGTSTVLEVDPSFLRDEHNQLFESRKEYLKSSLDLVAAMSQLKFKLDKMLVDLIDELISESTITVNDESLNVDGMELGRKTIELSPNISNYLKDYKSWVEDVIESSSFLETNMDKTIVSTYTRTVKSIAPPKDLQNYNKALAEKTIAHIVSPKLGTPQKRPVSVPVTMPSKSGWLYMKTYSSSNPRKEIWVKRWCFLQGTVFGMFSLSQSKTFVEESDKFGIFLTSVRFLPNYTRNFCFELKIIGRDKPESDLIERSKDINIIYQADDLAELKSWIVAFHDSKKYIMAQDQKGLQYEVAFKRFSPQYYEFASNAGTVVDTLLTTSHNDTLGSRDGTINLKDSIKALLSSEELKLVQDNKTFLFEFIGTPIATENTGLAMLSNLMSDNHSFPDAITANIWGTSSWNDVSHMIDEQKEKPDILKSLPPLHQTLADIKYPNYYSRSLKVADVQFRTIFYSNNKHSYSLPKQFLLLRFGSIWKPNKKQKFAAICYASKDYFHVYMNCSGFTYLARQDLNEICDVEYSKSEETIHLIRHDGIKYDLNAYFTDPKSITAKLKFLIENRISDNPKNEGDILVKFKQIDQAFAQKSTNAKLKSYMGLNSVQDSLEQQSLSKLNSSLWTIKGTTADLLKRKFQLQKEYSASYKHIYPVPCKGLVHLLFGQRSDAFPRAFFLARKGSDYNITQYWAQRQLPDGTTQLVRKLQFQVNRTSSFVPESPHDKEEYLAQQVTVEQVMVKMIDNCYYEIDQDPIIIQFPFAKPIKLSLKYIISERSDHDADMASRLMLSSNYADFITYYKVEFIKDINHESEIAYDQSIWEQFIYCWVLQSTKYEFNTIKSVIDGYLGKIGSHGKLTKAIKMGGRLGISDTIETQPSVSEKNNKNVETPHRIQIQYTFTLLLKVIIKMIVLRATNFCFLIFRLFLILIHFGATTMKKINKILLAVLVISALSNVFLLGRSTVNYWSVRRAEHSFKQHMASTDGSTMQRALYVKDLDLLTNHLVTGFDNVAFKKFNEENYNNQLNNFKYKDTRREIAIRRNELLVELKIMQNMEKELVKGDYRLFLIEELNKCESVSVEMPDIWNTDKKLQEYCSVCKSEFTNMNIL